MSRMRVLLERASAALADRDVAPESLTVAAVAVSVVAGCALAVGGAAREPRLWLLVPLLGVARLALYAVGVSLRARLVDSRAPARRPEERFHGQR
ncbi:MAG TPA: hypothetical protein VHN37_02165 [Actinomycetota bacterium]|nr:hypothetical protein [Actinomycetota bacterium]